MKNQYKGSKMRSEHVSLKEFVKNSLVDIIEGVIEAEIETVDTEATIAPKIDNHHKPNLEVLVKDEQVVNSVDFDVAVIAESNGEGKSSIGVVAGNIGIWGRLGFSRKNKNVSRVRFTVPLVLPRGDAREKIRQTRDAR